MSSELSQSTKKINHFLYCPLTGLGLYNGYRGKRWLRNRIQIFKQFVISSLKAQTSKNFILWISVRYEDRYDALIKEFKEYLSEIKEFKTVFTHAGCLFWDDKYPDNIAQIRLVQSVHDSIGELMEFFEASDYVYMTIQPSDDVYHKEFVERTQRTFESMPEIQALGFRKGYVMNYLTHEIAEWNPTTIPPFFTIKFPTPIFIDPLKHVEYTGPYKSHEYIADKLKCGFIEDRGFIVGTHLDNISTVFDHPYTGLRISREILKDFGLEHADVLRIPFSIRRTLFNRLSYGIKRKLRYWAGEKKWIGKPFFSIVYNFLRG